MAYVILVDGSPVEQAGTEGDARRMAEQAQAEAHLYVEDSTGGSLAVVGFAPTDCPEAVSYLKPRDCVPDVLVPLEFRQFR